MVLGMVGRVVVMGDSGLAGGAGSGCKLLGGGGRDINGRWAQVECIQTGQCQPFIHMISLRMNLVV